MKRRTLIVIGCSIVLVAVAGTIAYGTWFSPRARIMAGVERAAQGFLARDKAAILGLISEEFDQGGVTKGKVDQALDGLFAQFERIKVVTDDQRITVDGDTAVDTVKVIVVVTRRGEQGFALGSFGNPYPVTLKLKRQKWWQITALEGVSFEY